jgi:predicted transcriptional regulator
MKKKKKFPSQIKYEKEHPLISFRVKRDEYEKIQQLADKSRKSKSALVRMALLLLEKDFSATYKSIQETKKQELKASGTKRVMMLAILRVRMIGLSG